MTTSAERVAGGWRIDGEKTWISNGGIADFYCVFARTDPASTGAKGISAFLVPARFVTTRFGIDYVRVAAAGATPVDVPVQRGRDLPRPDMPDGIEILSGLQNSDRLVRS